MACDYQYYKENESVPRLYCSINQSYCIYSKMCYKTHRFIETELQEGCKIRMEKENIIPKDAKRVLFIKKGFIYVQIDADHVEKFVNTFGDDVKFVYIVDGKPVDKLNAKKKYAKKN